MYPLTEECPKALLPVCNMPLIYYPIRLLEKNGFKGDSLLVCCTHVYDGVCVRGAGGGEGQPAQSDGGVSRETEGPPGIGCNLVSV